MNIWEEVKYASLMNRGKLPRIPLKPQNKRNFLMKEIVA